MPTRKLAVVPPDTKPQRRRTVTVKAAIEVSELDGLRAMRRTLADAIDGKPPAHALAGMMRQLREIDKELRAIEHRDDPKPEPDTDDASHSEAFDSSAI
jgi:hypothetical protein